MGGDLPYPPTHPEGYRAVRDLPEPAPERGPRYTAPAPPPADLGIPVDKWRHMTRAERRALLRAVKRATS